MYKRLCNFVLWFLIIEGGDVPLPLMRLVKKKTYTCKYISVHQRIGVYKNSFGCTQGLRKSYNFLFL